MRLLLSGPFPPPHGGVQINLTAIRDYVLARNIPCSVINLTRHRDSRADNLYHPTGFFQVIWLLLTLPYDIIHMHHGGELTGRLMGMYLLCGLLPFKKSVLTCHSGGLTSAPVGQQANYWSIYGFIFRRLDCIIVVNEAMAAMFQRFGVAEQRIRLILPYSVKIPDAQQKLPTPLAEFFASHSPCLLGVAALRTEYDVPLQINALEEVRKHYPQAGLAIIGGGELEQEIRALIGSKSYASHILLCNDVEHRDTLCAIRDCDIFLRTTHYDGDAVSVREALIMGKPVVATDNGMRPPDVACIPVGDTAALSQTICRVLANPNARPASQDRGEGNLQAVLDLYQELLGRPSAK